MSYDAWLEAPYQRAHAEGDAFIDWCESRNIDYESDDAWNRFQADMDDAREAAAEAYAEQMMEECHGF